MERWALQALGEASPQTQKAPDSPGSASYPIPQHKDLLGSSTSKQAPDSVQDIVLSMRLLCKHLNLKVAQHILAFGYYKFPGAEDPKNVAAGFKFGRQGIIYLFIWLWILKYLYTDEP